MLEDLSVPCFINYYFSLEQSCFFFFCVYHSVYSLTILLIMIKYITAVKMTLRNKSFKSRGQQVQWSGDTCCCAQELLTADLYGELAMCLPCFECFTCINLSVPLPLFIVEGRRGTESFNNRSLCSIYHILLLVCLASPFKGKDSVWCSFVPWSLAGSWPNRKPHAVSENTAQATGLLP